MGEEKSESNLRMKLKAPTDAFKFYANAAFFTHWFCKKKSIAVYYVDT
jgi:hypothetical protein